MTTSTTGGRMRIWDSPLRLFHWALVALILLAYLTAEGLVFNMDVHVLAGEGVLTLILFRFFWGLVGSDTARFSQFVKGPGAAIAYLKAARAGEHQPHLGHNPAGALMVLLLMTLAAAQAGTGLFSADDVLTEGPLASLVSSSTSGTITEIHGFLFNLLMAAILLHIAAVFFYLLVKKDNLIRPMVLGVRPAIPGVAEPKFVSPLIAAALLAVAVGIVYGIVSLGG
jgi:cytochrome b